MILLKLAVRILTGCFLIVQNMALPVPTISLSSIHANTIAGTDTQTDDVVWYPSAYNGDMGSTFVYQLWDFPNSNGPSIWLFSPTATSTNRRMGILSATDLLYTRNSLLHLRLWLYLSATGGEDRLQVHTLSYDASTNTYGQVSWAYHANIAAAIKTISDDSPSSYVFYLDVTTATSYVRKWDTNLPNRDPAGTVVAPTNSECMQLSNNKIVIYGAGASTAYWVDRSSLAILSSFTGPIEPRGFAIDNQDSNIYFATRYTSPYGVSRILLGTSTYVQTHAIPPVAGQSSYEYANALNLGNMAYIGLIRYHETNLPFRIYAKADLVEISVSRYTPVYFPAYAEDNLLPSFVVDGKKTLVHFGLQVQVSGVYNFQSWRATFDICQTRVNLVCTSCPAGYYLDMPGFVDNSCLQITYGPDVVTNSIVSCQDPNCDECGADTKICTKCTVASSSPWLYQDKCFQISALPNGIGANSATMTAIPCTDPFCVNCRADYTRCAFCNPVLGYLADSNGVCKYDNTTAVKIVSSIYDSKQAIASVTFETDILVTGNRTLLNFTVIDTATSREYTCEQLNCVKQVQSRGVSVTFKTNLTIPAGRIIFSSHPDIKITRAIDSRLFLDYPVIIPAETLFAVQLRLQIPTITIDDPAAAAKSMQLPATLFFAAMYPSLTPLFDDIFAKITVIAFYSSPPITALDNAILSFKNVTVLPFQIPNLFEKLLSSDSCRPGQMLDRYEYKCRFLENYGVDLTILLFMFAISLLAKGAVILVRRKEQKKKNDFSKGNVKEDGSSPDLAGPEAPKGIEEQTLASPTKEGKQPSETSDETAKSPKPKPSGLEKVLVWFDQHFGFLLLLSKLEGKQAEYLVYAFQDFWSNDGSSSKTISTVAAVLMMTYPAFSMYAIQSLVGFLCREYHIPRVFYGRSKIIPFSKLQTRVEELANRSLNGLTRDTIGTRELSHNLRAVEYSLIQSDSEMNLESNTGLQKRYFYPWRFWFDGCVVPSSDLWLSVPAVAMLKNIVSALLIVSTWLTPKSQCVVGLIVELSFFLYIWNYSLKNRCLEVFAERVIGICSVGFLFAKYFSHSVDQEFLQTSLALTLLTIILVMMLVTALVTILSVVVWAVKLFRQSGAKKSPSLQIPKSMAFGKVAVLPVSVDEKMQKPIIKVKIPSALSPGKVAKHWINQHRTTVLRGDLDKATDQESEKRSPNTGVDSENTSQKNTAQTGLMSQKPSTKTGLDSDHTNEKYSATDKLVSPQPQLRSLLSDKPYPTDSFGNVPVIVRLAKQRAASKTELRRVSSRAK